MLFDISQQPWEPIPQKIRGGLAMDGGRLILQRHRHEVTAADQSIDPGAGIDGIEHGIVNIHLLLDVEIDRGQVILGTVEGGPVIAATAPVGNASRCRIGGGWIGQGDDERLVDRLLDRGDIFIQQAAGFGEQIGLVWRGRVAQPGEPEQIDRIDICSTH